MTSGEGKKRDVAVDVLRGLAISIMVWGHLGVAIYGPSHLAPSASLQGVPPLYGEVIGGVVPVLFIMLSGMMVAYGSDRGLGVQLKRMAMLLFAGAALDVVFWRILPFTTVDVLYLIGVTLPLAHLFRKHLPTVAQWVVAGAVIGGTPLLQQWLGYSDYPLEYALSGTLYTQVANQSSVVHHWLIDGWFPIFPWLGVSFVGVILGARRKERSETDAALIGVGVAAIAMGVALGFPEVDTRSLPRLTDGAGFNPPTLSYLLTSLGCCMLLLPIADRVPAFSPLVTLGRASLFIYVVHFFAVKVVVVVLPKRVDALVGTLLVLVVLAGLAFAIHVRDRGLSWLRKKREST